MKITLEDYIRINSPTFEKHSDVIFIKDLNLRFTYINNAYLQISRFSKEEILGKTFEELSNSAQATSATETDKIVIDIQEPLTFEERLQVNDGQTRSYLITKTPIMSEDELIGLLISARDTEAQYVIKEELRKNLKLIEILLDTVPYPIFIKNFNGKYIKVNKAYAADLDSTVDEIIGKSDLELFGEKLGSFYREKDLKVINDKERIIYISSGLNNETKYITTKDILQDVEGNAVGVVGIVNTFQELTHIQDDLMNIQRIESISQLAAGIAHDLNNILTNVVALSSMLLYIEQEEEKKADLESIYTSGRKASDLINKLKTFAQKTDLKMVDFNLNQVISDTMQLVGGKYRKRYEIIQNLDDKNFIITGDKSQVSQLVMNLVINGIEAMEEGKKLSITTYKEKLFPEKSNFVIQPDNFTEGDYYCIEIEDQGMGIETSIMNRIFEPYYTSKGEEGTGLGLSIVFGVITSHKGALKLESEVGKGTTFKVYFPVSEII